MDLKALLKSALKNLGKDEYFDKYYTYLESEWFYTINELKIAIKDGAAWSDIQLPGRLKLELKKLILEMNNDPDNNSNIRKWTKCYSKEHNSFYYFNKETFTTQWKIPDEPYDEDDSVKESDFSTEKSLQFKNLSSDYLKKDSNEEIQTNHFFKQKCQTSSGDFSTHNLYVDNCRIITSSPPSELLGSYSQINPYPQIPNCPPYPLDEYLPAERYNHVRYHPKILAEAKITPKFNAWEPSSINMGLPPTATPIDVNDLKSDFDQSDEDELYDENIKILNEMGFSSVKASEALMENSNDLTAATTYLINQMNAVSSEDDHDSTMVKINTTRKINSLNQSPTKKFTVPLPRVNLFSVPGK